MRPLKQITGDSEFNEIFFEDVRVPKENLLGPLNAGWQVLVSTLMHERFGISETIGGTEVILAQLVETGQEYAVDWAEAAAEDDEIRQQIAQFAIEVAAKKYNGLRSLTKRLKGQQPGAEASIGKLISTELSQRMTKFATRLLGRVRDARATIAVRTRRRLDAADPAGRVADDRRRYLGGAEEHDRRAHPAIAERLIARKRGLGQILRNPCRFVLNDSACWRVCSMPLTWLHPQGMTGAKWRDLAPTTRTS